jgi:nitrogen fixation-related uncharacterized protein
VTNEKLLYLYSTSIIIQVIKLKTMRWAGHGTRIEDKRSSCRVLVDKPEGRKPLERPRHR